MIKPNEPIIRGQGSSIDWYTFFHYQKKSKSSDRHRLMSKTNQSSIDYYLVFAMFILFTNGINQMQVQFVKCKSNV